MAILVALNLDHYTQRVGEEKTLITKTSVKVRVIKDSWEYYFLCYHFLFCFFKHNLSEVTSKNKIDLE